MNFKKLLFAVVAFVLVIGCASKQKITNFQDLDVAVAQAEMINYETQIKCDDELSILVSCPDMSLAQQYNLNVPTSTSSSSLTLGTAQVGTQPSDVTYRVDANGEINFPILGKIKVEGMTRAELVESLTNEIKKDIKDPVVTVTVTNFNITIIGDVAKPGNYTFNSEKVNVIQAFAEAGDLTLTSLRNDILLIRKVNGRQTYTKLDMTTKHILESEQFYLQQNDIVYVRPDATKQRLMDARQWWTTALTSLTTALSIVALIIAL